jgi:hypothetical protein
LDEEMGRVLRFCAWKAKWWRTQQSRRTLDDPILSDGLKAFAEQQAAQELDIADNWCAKWTAARARAQPIIEGLVDGYQEVEHVGPSETIELYIEDDEYEPNGGY